MCCYTIRAALQSVSPKVSSLPPRKHNSDMKNPLWLSKFHPAHHYHHPHTSCLWGAPVNIYRTAVILFQNTQRHGERNSSGHAVSHLSVQNSSLPSLNCCILRKDFQERISERSPLGQICVVSCAMHSPTEPRLVSGSLATHPYLATRPEWHSTSRRSH